MRVYLPVDNELFLSKIDRNRYKSGAIYNYDLYGSFHDLFNYDLPPFLAYNNMEEYIENCVCAFTTPKDAKIYVNDQTVILVFDVSKSDVKFFNKNEFYDYVEEVYSHEDKYVNSEGTPEDGETLLKQVDELTDAKLKSITKIGSYYNTLAILPNLDLFNLKACIVEDDNKDIKDICSYQNRQFLNFEIVSSNKIKQLEGDNVL